MGYSKEEIKKEDIRDTVIKLLENNNEWKNRYKVYIEKINDVLSKDDVLSKGSAKYKLFRTPEQLSRYSSVSRRDGKTYDLRYNGQSVAKVICTTSSISLKPNINNAKRFGFQFTSEENKKDNLEWGWNGNRANDFRSHFKNNADKSENDNQPEHRLENRLLRLFSSSNKPFSIVPIRLYNSFFQMPTPLGASDHSNPPTYSGQYGGGIDILARVGIRRGMSRICVMEIKDENNNNESQADAMGQAVAYAVFIAQLLRSDSGQKWWDFFMNRDNDKNYSEKGIVPKDLDIDVVTIMPVGNTKEYCNKELCIDELKTTLHCHSLYYNIEKYNNKGQILFTNESTYLNYLKGTKG